jgi:hypothetical protein
MLSIYYKIWADAIRLTKSSKSEGKNWKIFTIIPISALMGINLVTIFLWIRAFSHRKFTVILPVKIFNLSPVNTAISILITFFVPFVILNYLLIFDRERYNGLLKTYKSKSGKIYLWYIALTLGIFAAPYVLKWIF